MNTCIYEQRSVITPPFLLALPHNTPTELAKIVIYRSHKCECNCVIIKSVVNYSVTFTPPSAAAPLTTPGYGDITFELLVNGNVVYRVLQTALQKGFPLPPANFSTPATTFEIASLLHVNQTSACCCNPCGYYDILTLRATANLVAPLTTTGTATIAANAGAVTLIAELLDPKRDDDGLDKAADHDLIK